MTYTVVRESITRNYIYRVDNIYGRYVTSAETGKLVHEVGWRVTKQKADGKDGRAYERRMAGYFGEDAQAKAVAFFESHCL